VVRQSASIHNQLNNLERLYKEKEEIL